MYPFAFHLLALEFAVLSPIRGLPHFPGPHWSALFRNLFHAFEPRLRAANPTIWVQPIETGILEYETGDRVSLGLVVPAAAAPPLEMALENFNRPGAGNGRGHFQPGVTLRLENVTSRLDGRPWRGSAAALLSREMVAAEVEELCARDRFTLLTLSPLRIPRPPGRKESGHRYCDADFFLAGHREAACRRLVEKVRGLAFDSFPVPAADTLKVAGGALNWLDVAYAGKTMGGVVGALEIAGRLQPDEALRLVLGQYLGVGKNAAFGLGFYRISELDPVRTIRPLVRGTTLLARAVTPETLAGALARLPDSSPGPDGMSLADARAAGPALFEKLRAAARAGPPVGEIPLKPYRLPKSGGGSRTIYVQNLGERLLHRSFTDCLAPVIDCLLSSSSYAYRRGLSHQRAARTLQELLAEGYCCGLKADISAFFDSVRTRELLWILEGLFPAEPLVEHLAAWLRQVGAQGVSGLPQGWVLSPVLSNLYLDRFDRAMAAENFRLVRFADDFAVLFRVELTAAEGTRIVEQALERLGLVLKPEKSVTMVRGRAVTFLGHVVSAEELLPVERPDEPAARDWLPVFRPDWHRGLPVYLTSACRGAYSSGPHLVIRHDDESSDTIPWSRIGRLVVVGRSSFSGGVVYRAVREQIPITFIDVMGRTRGQLQAAGHEVANLAAPLAQRLADDNWRLALSRRLVSAKIHNGMVLLRRNRIAVLELKQLEKKAAAAASLEALRGFEGAAARLYFEHFAGLVAPFVFKGRCYHPPDGPVNVMLSFGYTLLYNRLAAVLRDKGFEPRQGIFHVGRGRHCALASDLLEPLRHLAERIVLSLIHLKELTPDNFYLHKGTRFSAWRLDGDGFRTFISRYEHTMASRFTPRQGRKMSYNAWLDETVDALMRDVRYEIPYQPLRID